MFCVEFFGELSTGGADFYVLCLFVYLFIFEKVCLMFSFPFNFFFLSIFFFPTGLSRNDQKPDI